MFRFSTPVVFLRSGKRKSNHSVILSDKFSLHCSILKVNACNRETMMTGEDCEVLIYLQEIIGSVS